MSAEQSRVSGVRLNTRLDPLVEDDERRVVSRSLTKPERNYSQTDRETLALIWGVKKLSRYLLGRKFTMETDHKSLVRIFGPQENTAPLAAARTAKWALFLAGFTYDIRYKPGDKLGNADALSKPPIVWKD